MERCARAGWVSRQLQSGASSGVGKTEPVADKGCARGKGCAACAAHARQPELAGLGQGRPRLAGRECVALQELLARRNGARRGAGAPLLLPSRSARAKTDRGCGARMRRTQRRSAMLGSARVCLVLRQCLLPEKWIAAARACTLLSSAAPSWQAFAGTAGATFVPAALQQAGPTPAHTCQWATVLEQALLQPSVCTAACSLQQQRVDECPAPARRGWTAHVCRGCS